VTPAVLAKCASLWKRCAPAVCQIRIAALSGPQPVSGAVGEHEVSQLALELLRLACDCRDPSCLLARDPHPGGLLHSRIAAVPFTLRNLKEDLEDLGSNFNGAPNLEFRHASKALELEQCGLCYQRIPPDYRFPYGHTHKEQEEIYVVVRGSGRMKLDDEIVEVKEWDVVRVPPGTWRGYEGGPEGFEILVFGAPNLGENPRDDVDGQRDWWAD
jgi:mannose-6-phosphate isomerase-like protein (cupin superfamily)